ncbi:MAG TPA: TSUP family transporter, partial [Myxococcota bacterium]
MVVVVDVVASLMILVGSLVVGVLGGLLGVGGGVFLVPFLIFVASLSAKAAVAASLCCVIGTSASASLISGKSG